MSKNKNTFLNTEPLDELANEEYDILPDSTKDLLDNFEEFDYDLCVGCPKSQNSVASKLIHYTLNDDTLQKSQNYNCGHCKTYKNIKK